MKSIETCSFSEPIGDVPAAGAACGGAPCATAIAGMASRDRNAAVIFMAGMVVRSVDVRAKKRAGARGARSCGLRENRRLLAEAEDDAEPEAGRVVPTVLEVDLDEVDLATNHDFRRRGEVDAEAGRDHEVGGVAVVTQRVADAFREPAEQHLSEELRLLGLADHPNAAAEGGLAEAVEIVEREITDTGNGCLAHHRKFLRDISREADARF